MKIIHITFVLEVTVKYYYTKYLVCSGSSDRTAATQCRW